MLDQGNASQPLATIVIEWENAIDVEDKWSDRALRALEKETESYGVTHKTKLQILYLFNQNAVTAEEISNRIAAAAPKLSNLAHVEFIPTPGLTYYKLKNYGASLSQSEITIFLDSDAGPCPGWLESMIASFNDDTVQVAAGFTTLGHEDFLSRTMALIWIMYLPSEKLRTRDRYKMYPNNCAMRTEFMKKNPFPDLASFKKQCGFWQADVEKRGIKIHYAPSAMTIHAPHPGVSFLAWRAWNTGNDRDFKMYQTTTKSHIARIGLAFAWWATKLGRSTYRIIFKGHEVDLPIWQRPAAIITSTAYFSVMLSGQLYSVLMKRHATIQPVMQ